MNWRGRRGANAGVRHQVGRRPLHRHPHRRGPAGGGHPYGEHSFDSVYPALGSDTHTELAKQVDADIAEDGTLTVDSHQRTSVPGLYAAGDLVLGLDQISHAMGEGGVAATTIRNDLAKERPIIREALRGNSLR
jgi:pyruvate/2-oxoglutarate dehydrogenase complex dihydrolipoamide dehydrogenase (E3) component